MIVAIQENGYAFFWDFSGIAAHHKEQMNISRTSFRVAVKEHLVIGKKD